MYTSGRPPWGGRARASFVECGLILMGTDDKQRKQASSLPGEICLLLAGVQRGPDTRTSRLAHRHETRRREPHRPCHRRLHRHSWLPLQPPGRRRARNSRKGRGRLEKSKSKSKSYPTRNAYMGDLGPYGVQRPFTHVLYSGYGCGWCVVSRRVAIVGVMRVNQREKGRRGERIAEEDDRYLPLLRTLSLGSPAAGPATDCVQPNYIRHRCLPVVKQSVCSPN